MGISQSRNSYFEVKKGAKCRKSQQIKNIWLKGWYNTIINVYQFDTQNK